MKQQQSRADRYVTKLFGPVGTTKPMQPEKNTPTESFLQALKRVRSQVRKIRSGL